MAGEGEKNETFWKADLSVWTHVCAHVSVSTCTQKCVHRARLRSGGMTVTRIPITPESSTLSPRCLLILCEHFRLGMQAGKCGHQASQGATVPRAGKVSLLHLHHL